MLPIGIGNSRAHPRTGGADDTAKKKSTRGWGSSPRGLLNYAGEAAKVIHADLRADDGPVRKPQCRVVDPLDVTSYAVRPQLAAAAAATTR